MSNLPIWDFSDQCIWRVFIARTRGSVAPPYDFHVIAETAEAAGRLALTCMREDEDLLLIPDAVDALCIERIELVSWTILYGTRAKPEAWARRSVRTQVRCAQT